MAMCKWFVALTIVGLLASLAACTGLKQPEFDPLHPVTGKVQRGGKPLVGGSIQFQPVPDKQEFSINSLVDQEGNFKLTTVRTTDTKGERRPGAPAGEYTVVYTPESKDQTVAFEPPITLPKKVTVETKDNNLTLEIPAR